MLWYAPQDEVWIQSLLTIRPHQGGTITPTWKDYGLVNLVGR